MVDVSDVNPNKLDKSICLMVLIKMVPKMFSNSKMKGITELSHCAIKQLLVNKAIIFLKRQNNTN